MKRPPSESTLASLERLNGRLFAQLAAVFGRLRAGRMLRDIAFWRRR